MAQRVPLLRLFEEHLFAGTVDPILEIAACRWAAGVPADDELSLQAREAAQQLLGGIVLAAYVKLIEASGFQGDKVDLYRRVGENTEATVHDLVPDMSGGARG
ncbi:hypothetical protein ACIBTZ_32365 [Micromonospora sp. NPDC049460]|uniref:hypothetical protein n=1 Tax=Micromonospora sp. NPDC049460 TaxID=3364272 RepID=UPI0037AA8603